MDQDFNDVETINDDYYDDDDDDETEDIHKFPRPWKGDILAALSFLLKCVRFPVMQKHYIVEKVEGNAVVMAAEVM
ncbi:BTB-domain-containing protein [Gigaspora margarita]|uniref:BTB-domain-containing protein n=1 Tax=Gigaspora margarita TaxID=4874 RepID=A0A8H3X3P4_GIGMA|nr:BTB-domain-containing protein [Gigaspora margarita]